MSDLFLVPVAFAKPGEAGKAVCELLTLRHSLLGFRALGLPVVAI